MPEFSLKTRPALDGYRRQFSETELVEVTDKALVSIAIPLGESDRLREAMVAAYGTTFPEPGSSSLSADGAARFLGLQQDQCFAFFEFEGNEAIRAVSGTLDGKYYCTDQSDSWAILRLSGTLALAALERVCPLDLAPTIFRPGNVARTVMEHLGVIIVCEDENSYLLMSPRSSALSFLHAIETSLENLL